MPQEPSGKPLLKQAGRLLCAESPWPHRLAVALAVVIFPLIWVGGLVTTYEAGMAVPDWPTTYGYNMFLYPWQTWLFGPWDLFIEHGHRLLAALVGLLTIALAVVLYRCEDRGWLRRLGLAAVALVIFQGVLGGMRVRLDERLLAQVHGCVGPAFFALAAALAVFTSRRWRAVPCDSGDVDRGVFRLALVTTLLAYAQLVLGSQVRHVSLGSDVTVFRAAVLLHLVVAGLVTFHVLLLAVRAGSRRRGDDWLVGPARFLAVLVLMQLALGCGAWVVNYGWPAWLSQYRWAAGYVVG
ncbi:MAG TPA: COX15/CtaA family protein, partial [Pirellulales bacterium]|nr:COX15/CtaA family protein [Pirellulales bacterium]